MRREKTHQPFFYCFVSTIIHVLCRRANSLCEVVSPDQLVCSYWPFTRRRQLASPYGFSEWRRNPQRQMAQQIRTNLVMDHQLDYDLSPRSRVCDLGVSQRAVRSCDLQEAEQWLDASIFERRGNLVLSRYPVRIHPRYVGCWVYKAGVEGK